MRQIPYGRGIAGDLERALTENATAKAMYEAMGPEEQEKFRRRAGQARDWAELKDAVDSLVGWQIGHGPYQE